MSTITPTGWAAYACFQAQLASRNISDDHTWGLEAALDVVQDRDCPPDLITVELLRRACATASRRERDHRQRFHAELSDDHDAADPTDLVEQVGAREVLANIARRVQAPADIALVAAIAEGCSYTELHDLLGEKPSALRSRVMRLRMRLND